VLVGLFTNPNGDDDMLTGEMLPSHVGAPLGQEHGGGTYFMIEMHYENPEGRVCK